MEKMSLPVLLLILLGCSEPSTRKLHEGVYLHKTEKGTFDLLFDPDEGEEWCYTEVDSLSFGEGYAFLFYAIGKGGTEKQWYYVAGAPLEFKKGFGGWYDGEFRKYRLGELGEDRRLYGRIRAAQTVWKEH